MAKYSASVATTIPVDQAEELDRIAKEREITRSTLIREYIEKGIASHKGAK